MGAAIQTVAGFATNPGATFTAATASPGDSFNPANFNPGGPGFIDAVHRSGATAGAVRLISPRLHDSTRPIEFHTDLANARMLFPSRVGQPVYPADVLTVQLTGGSSESEVLGITYFYGDLPGSAARLHQWQDLSGLVKNIKTVVVAVTSSGTIGTWVDTVITTTENLLKADTDYACLGYMVDAPLALVGIKGPDTANYRIADTGSDFTEDTASIYVENSQRHGQPWIPVINSNNRAGTFVSVVDKAASTAANVVLVLAELGQKVTP